MTDNIEDPKTQFMQRMLESYSKVHNKKYWKNIDKILSGKQIETILDIGCGRGLLLQELIKNYKPSVAYGIDLSPIMLEKAKEILASTRDTVQIELIQQHMQEDVSLPTSLDLVVCSRVLRSFENIYDVMTSVYNCLNHEGIFVILDWDRKDLTEYAYMIRNNNFIDEVTDQEIIRLHRNFSRYSLNDWKELLEFSKFKIVYQFQLTHYLTVSIGKK